MQEKKSKTSGQELTQSSPPEQRDQSTASKADGALAAENKATDNDLVTSSKLPSAAEAIEMLRKDLSGYDPDFSYGIIMQLGQSQLSKEPDGAGFMFARSFVKGITSGNQIELCLVAQMVAVHNATMGFAKALGESKRLDEIETCGNTLNKLARTFTSQAETLQRLRSGNEQKVTVNNVSVTAGGQAIVGSVTHNSAGSGTNESAKPPLSLSDQSGTAMPVLKPDEQSATTVPRIEQDQQPAPSTTRRKRRS